MSTKNQDEVTTVDIKTKDHYEVTIDYNNTNNSTMKKVKKKKLQKKTIWSKKKGSMWKEPVEKIFTTIQSTKFLVIAYIWRFILIVLLLIYVYKYSNSKIETVTVLVTDVIIGYIFINMSLRMSLEFHDRIIHIIFLTVVVWLTSFSYYIPILFLVLDQKDKHIHLFMFAVIFILDFIVCLFALGTSVRRKYRLEEQDSSDIKHDELVIKNYHTSITIKGPITKLEELKTSSDETLHELKMHLEYVPADELIYHNCKDYLEKDLKKHIKCPFLMHNPYDPYEKDDEQQ
ncbi:36042_t:CDS:2 [Gigaspora margarita]|uniref:36042_t:CDS:1 n=1 Tax=Gigaspora margarita TaxID=4874 RepID=A0ABN7VHT7_GIGMA|nr:36042_t:CDS:2 [Gigaspora margarita]